MKLLFWLLRISLVPLLIREIVQRNKVTILLFHDINKEIGDDFWQEHLGNMEILEYDAKYTAGRGTTINDVKEVLIRNFEIEQTPLSTLFE